jgi:regulator of nonsense transcripts 1
MDSFDNFQYDSASSYGGGISVVDDNSSVYTATTNTGTPVDLESLSIVDDRSQTSSYANGHDGHHHHSESLTIDEEFDAVLDDLKDEGAMDLPPHACRYEYYLYCFRGT